MLRKKSAKNKTALKKSQSKKAQPVLSKAEAELLKAKAQKIKAKPQRILAKARKKKPIPLKLSEEMLVKDMIKEAKVLKISDKTAGKYVKIVSEKVVKWAKKRASVTQSDINRQIAKEVKKYNKDLAFIYENRGKII